MKWTELAQESEIAIGESKIFQLEKAIVCLWRTETQWHAFEDRCPHRGGPLSEGTFANGQVSCPWHQAVFQLSDGSCVSGPSNGKLRVFSVRVVNGAVEVLSPSSS